MFLIFDFEAKWAKKNFFSFWYQSMEWSQNEVLAIWLRNRKLRTFGIMNHTSQTLPSWTFRDIKILLISAKMLNIAPKSEGGPKA